MRQRVMMVSENLECHLIAKHILETDGLRAILSQGMDEAIRCLEQFEPQAVIVDCRKGSALGEQLCKRLKSSQRASTLFIAIIEKGAESLYIDLINAGTDRCFNRPFEPQKLLEYLRAQLTASQQDKSASVVKADGLEFDLRKRQVTYHDRDLNLGSLEFNLLLILTENAGRPLRRDELIRQAWPAGTFVDPRTVDVHVGYLRKALREADADRLIKTVRGMGYLLQL